MENPKEEKKPFPWGWVAAGCGVLAVVGLAIVVLLILKALPVLQNAFANRNPLGNLLPTPLVGATAAPTPEPGRAVGVPTPESGSEGKSIGSLPFKFSAVSDPAALPPESLMDQMVTALNLNNNTDFMAPKSYKGTATVDPSAGFTVGDAWCAADSTTLQQNMADMQFQLSINGSIIDLSQYPTLNFTDNQGEACAVTGLAVVPSGNLSGTYHIVLTQKYLKSLDDGLTGSPYPAGDVTFDFTIQFQSAPVPGKTT
jgi:hypothetical protein